MGVTYSDDGALLASGGVDKTVRLWDVSSGGCLAMVDQLPDSVLCVAWCTPFDDRLVAGCYDGSIVQLQVYEEEDYQCGMRLRWSGANGALTVMGASIQGAHGLTGLNKQLLKQCGATGEPENRFQEAGKKVMTMAAVVSRLRTPSGRTAVDPSESAYPTLDDFPAEPLRKTEYTKSRRFTVGRRDAVPQHL
jgi:hypothetical protein